MDIPDDILRMFKYLKKGWNQAELLRYSARRFKRKYRNSWQKQFAKQYAIAIEELLDGNSFENFAKRMDIVLPDIKRSWLGYKRAQW